MKRHADPPRPRLHRSVAGPTPMPRGSAGLVSIQHSLQTAFPHVSEDAWAGYNAVILLFSLIAIGMLAVGVVIEITPSTRSLLAYADFTVCMIFLIDFAISLSRAEDRWRYLRTWGWVDLLSAVPLFDSMRWGRAARIVRILRVIRGVKATRFLASVIFRNRARNALLAGSFVAVVVVFASSFAILQFEAVEGGNIKSAEDAIWWAVCTVTTVGYGDLYPITWEGRVVAFVLMVTGASSFGALSGFIAGNFIGSSDTTLPAAQIDSPDIRRLADEVAALRADLEARQDNGGRAAA